MRRRGTVLITFGDGSVRWRKAARRFGEEANTSGLFASTRVFGAADLRRIDINFFRSRQPLYRPGVPGFGAYAWKPSIIRWQLENLGRDFDRVLFLDCGTHLNTSVASRRRFNEYEEFASDTGALLMHMPHLPENQWTKPAVFAQLGLSAADQKSPQVMGGVVMLPGGERALDFVRTWEELAALNGGELLIDPRDSDEAGPSLVAHRHDQSLLSCLSKVHGLPSIPDETYFEPHWNRDGRCFPIWTVRNRTGVRFSTNPLWFKTKVAAERTYLRVKHPHGGGITPDLPPDAITLDKSSY